MEPAIIKIDLTRSSDPFFRCGQSGRQDYNEWKHNRSNGATEYWRGISRREHQDEAGRRPRYLYWVLHADLLPAAHGRLGLGHCWIAMGKQNSNSSDTWGLPRPSWEAMVKVGLGVEWSSLARLYFCAERDSGRGRTLCRRGQGHQRSEKQWLEWTTVSLEGVVVH